MTFAFSFLRNRLRGVMSTYPLSYLMCLIVAIVANTLIHIDLSELHEEFLGKLWLTAWLWVLLCTTIIVWCRSLGWKKWGKILLSLWWIIWLVWYFFRLPELDAYTHTGTVIQIVTVNLVVLLSILIIPFLRTNKTGNQFRSYLTSLVQWLILSWIYVVVLSWWISLLLLAIDQLFGVYISEERYGTIRVTVSSLVWWALLLWSIPLVDFRNKTLHYSKLLQRFGQYLFGILASLYGLVLVIYLLKIVVTRTRPSNNVVVRVYLFGGLVIITSYFLYPLLSATSNRKQSQLSFRWKYGTTIAHALLLSTTIAAWFAIYQRVEQYGMTEPRYYVMMLAIWLCSISLLLLIKKRQSLVRRFVWLCVLWLVSAFGPQNASNISKNSQMNRLESLLDFYALMNDEWIVTPVRDETIIPYDEYESIQSTVRYLLSHHGREISQLLDEEWRSLVGDEYHHRDRRWSSWTMSEELMTYRNLRRADEPGIGKYMRFSSFDETKNNRRRAVDVFGYSTVVPQIDISFVEMSTPELEEREMNYRNSVEIDEVVIGRFAIRDQNTMTLWLTNEKEIIRQKDITKTITDIVDDGISRLDPAQLTRSNGTLYICLFIA